MKLGAITDGISRDYEYALQQMQRYGLQYPELQYVWDQEIGDHSEAELERIQTLTEQYGMTISVISRQTFMGMQTMATQPDSPAYQAHFQALLRTIDAAKRLHVKTVRTMTFSKTVNIWGYDGADRWMAGNNQTCSCSTRRGCPMSRSYRPRRIMISSWSWRPGQTRWSAPAIWQSA